MGRDDGKNRSSGGKGSFDGKKRCLFHPRLLCPNANGECVFTGTEKVDSRVNHPV